MITYLQTTVGLFFIILVRYFIVSGLFYWALWGRRPENVHARKLQSGRPSPRVIKNEIKYSILTSAIFAVPGTMMLEAWKSGGTRIYQDLSQYGIWYIPVSAFIYLFLHDTYFYWTHRLIHHPKLFPIIHKVHHDSPNPTPWAAFSFHPWESLMGAIFIPILTFLIPIHMGVLVFVLTVMTVFAVSNHAGYEIFPDFLMRGPFGHWMITATHHDLHHKKYECNYGLYFRFWDRLLRTDVWVKTYDGKPSVS
jgi:sterol desaturase/sphingolipid hydroxylase (fatty acid hydroxylase superfamily)